MNQGNQVALSGLFMVALDGLTQRLGQAPRSGQKRTRAAVVHAELRLLFNPDVSLGVVRGQGQLGVLRGMRRQEAHAAEIVQDGGYVGEVLGDSEGRGELMGDGRGGNAMD